MSKDKCKPKDKLIDDVFKEWNWQALLVRLWHFYVDADSNKKSGVLTQ